MQTHRAYVMAGEGFPWWLELTADDLVRRAIIVALMCQFCVSTESIAAAHLVDFAKQHARGAFDRT